MEFILLHVCHAMLLYSNTNKSVNLLAHKAARIRVKNKC